LERPEAQGATHLRRKITGWVAERASVHLIEDLPRYRTLGAGFGYRPIDLTRIVDNVHWVKSHNSRLLQLADNCTFLCQRYHRDIGKSTRQAEAVRALWRVVEEAVWSGKIWP
jgi:hypothetical protein